LELHKKLLILFLN